MRSNVRSPSSSRRRSRTLPTAIVHGARSLSRDGSQTPASGSAGARQADAPLALAVSSGRSVAPTISTSATPSPTNRRQLEGREPQSVTRTRTFPFSMARRTARREPTRTSSTTADDRHRRTPIYPAATDQIRISGSGWWPRSVPGSALARAVQKFVSQVAICSSSPTITKVRHPGRLGRGRAARGERRSSRRSPFRRISCITQVLQRTDRGT
jgi:hypothetical protein